MRIIAGIARGRRLFAPEGMDTRPTADRTRESLFNILSRRLPDANVLDLFGGTGALALEAMSRGAAFAGICDSSAAAIRAIERNVQAVMGEEQGRVRVVRADYRQALRAFADKKYDIVFLDPPYKLTEAYADAVKRLLDADMLAQGAVVVMEKQKDVGIALDERMVIYDERNYRDTVISFAERRDEV